MKKHDNLLFSDIMQDAKDLCIFSIEASPLPAVLRKEKYFPMSWLVQVEILLKVSLNSV